MSAQQGTIKAIAIRTVKMGPMREIDRAEVVEGGGITEDIKVSPKRGVSFISAEQWDEVTQELGADLPWHTRRANVLVSGMNLKALHDKRIKVGSAVVHILDETTPCELMDELHQGLRAALTPDWRGGVLGRVEQAGEFKPGDLIETMDD